MVLGWEGVGWEGVGEEWGWCRGREMVGVGMSYGEGEEWREEECLGVGGCRQGSNGPQEGAIR